MKKILFSKYSNERNFKFAIKTVILEENGEKIVEKYPLNNSAKEHIFAMVDNYEKICALYDEKIIQPVNIIKKENCISSIYVEGISFEDRLKELEVNKEYDKFLELIKKFISIVESAKGIKPFKKTERFVEVFGDINLPNELKATDFSCFDLAFSNLIFNEDKIKIIDYEWCFDFPIPVEYIIFRSVILYLNMICKDEKLKNSVLLYLGFDDKITKLFSKMEESFQAYVCKDSFSIRELYKQMGRENYYIEALLNNTQEINDKCFTQIYLDYGNGFSEENSFRKEYEYYKKINIKIPITQDVKNIRIDPCDNSCVVILNRLVAISNEKGAYDISYGFNGLKTENIIIFNNDDPMFVYTIDDKIDYIEIDFIVGKSNEDLNYSLLKVVNEKLNADEYGKKKEKELSELKIAKDGEINEIIKEKNNEINEIIKEKNNEINEVIKAKDNEINEVIKEKNNKIKEIIDIKDNEIAKIKKANNEKLNLLKAEIEKGKDDIAKLIIEKKNERCNIDELEEQLTQIRGDYNNLNAEKEHIQSLLNIANDTNNAYANSTSWKITAPIRNVSKLTHKIYGASKHRIKKVLSFVKRAKRKVNVLTSEEHYNVDTLNFKNDTLKVAGWIFCEKKEINDLRIKIIIDDNVYYIEEGFKGIKRDDVYNVFKVDEAKKSGFEFNCSVYTSNHFEVVLEYMAESKFIPIHLGDFEGNSPEGTEEKVLKIIDDSMAVNIEEVINKYITKDKMDFSKVYEREYDIIIPIYNGYKYFKKLFSTLEKTKAKYNLILVNDCSPDENVSIFIKDYMKKYKNVTLIEHKINKGFVQSVNDGLVKATNDVVLLNTDVEIPEMWLERLMLPIVEDETVATTTPFTNSGTICSFPNFLEDNKIFENSDVITIDKAFNKVKPQYVLAPTGVGFCMGMSKKAIDIVGNLDYETFSKGYGEENDWCQRAIKAGFKNVIVENLFAFHNHGGSFPSEEKKRLLERNAELLSQKHPNYNRDVAIYCSENPHRELRNLLIFMLASKLCSKSYLIFNHTIGGGATMYLNNYCIEEINKNNAVTIIEYNINKSIYNIKFSYNDYRFNYYCNNIDYLLELGKIIRFDEIIINELVTYPKLYEVLDFILELKKITKAKLTHLLHDYFAICPTINLLNYENKHCWLDCSIKKCNECLAKKDGLAYNEYGSMEQWRDNWGNFLENCDDIIVFSLSSKDLLIKSFNKKLNIIVRPHKVEYMPQVNKKFKTTETINIGLLGVLCNHKGIEVIKEMLKKIKNKKLNIKIVLIGSCDEEINDENFVVTGAYTYDELPILSLKNDIDMFFISSIWPETFSYTAEEAMKMGFDVASFDLGAPVERIKKYEKGHIIKEMTADAVLDVIDNLELNPINKVGKVLFLTDYFSFSSRYRVEHFMQQLLINGVLSDFISTNDIDNVDLSDYSSVVFYRSKYTNKIESFIKEAHNKNILVYYDVDDLVFDYNKISYLDFLKKDDYKDFEKETQLTSRCMELCDGYITSTNHLKAEIQDLFKDKPICINRNVASLEMLTISNKAKKNTFKNSNKVILGYFSGSKTHDNDFAIINDVLLRIMEENSNVYLEIGGLLELSKEFDKFANRIIRFDFCDWKQLPMLIAGIDINLMPIENTIFHKCKSENKWTEAALVNVCTVASYNEEIEVAIKNGENGYLCKNEEQWYNSLSNLVKDSKLRKRISENANKDVLAKYTVLTAKKEAIEFVLSDKRLNLKDKEY